LRRSCDLGNGIGGTENLRTTNPWSGDHGWLPHAGGRGWAVRLIHDDRPIYHDMSEAAIDGRIHDDLGRVMNGSVDDPDLKLVSLFFR